MEMLHATTSTIGTLEPVVIRELWKHEAYGFSRWLFEHGEILGDVLGLRLIMGEREKLVGPFKVDIDAVTEAGQRVIIENQLEVSDHDHLGKLLTYATNLEAEIAVWVVAAGRPEHVRAIDWLNEYTPADTAFYLVKLEAYRIGESAPAPLFSVLAGPTQDAKAIGEDKKEARESHVFRRRFWQGLLEVAKRQGLHLHNGRTPGKEYWLDTGAGRAGLRWSYLIWTKKSSAAVELYIDTEDAAKNKAIFDQLVTDRTEIETAFGGSLEWQRSDENRYSRIRHTLMVEDRSPASDEWTAIQEAMVDSMARLHRALQPYVQSHAT